MATRVEWDALYAEDAAERSSEAEYIVHRVELHLGPDRVW
jgi:hypothetical protein